MYTRVIPRDLFNEAKLFKCLGKLALYQMDEPYGHNIKIEFNPEDAWRVQQNEYSGDIYVENMTITVNGDVKYVFTPMNSRNNWPLYMATSYEDGDEIRVFDETGHPTDEFIQLLRGIKNE